MKIKELQRELRKKKLDFALFINLDFGQVEPNIAYFSGYSGAGALVVPKKTAPFLVVPAMEYEKANKLKIVAVKKGKNKKISDMVYSALKKRKINCKKIAVDKTFLTVSVHSFLKKAFKGAKTSDISKFCSILRSVKTPEEVNRIKKACRISDMILGSCINNFKKFITEADAKAFLECETKKRGCELPFPPIVASGKNSVQPHYESSGKIKNGFCVIDFGVRYRGYSSDTTRTIHIGKIGKKEMEMYTILLNIQKKLIEDIKPGIKCSRIYDKAVMLLGKNKKHFTHGLGHGIGIKVHEFPNISFKSKDVFSEGEVFTIEPGIYMKNFGIRIEDTLHLGKKTEILTKIPKDLLVIS